jgi:beta-1,4-mannosyl-glycoprotein beta-1,4-N-acetylglucosaminyltransferase
MPFMFRNELDMLECQLYEHYDDIYRFVLVEATVNHQGRPKPLVYAENSARFAQWADKIVHVTVDWMPDAAACSDPWVRERAQRDAALGAMNEAGLDDGDIVVNVDVDEIPSAAALRAEPDTIMGMMLRYHPFAVDWEGAPGANGTLVRASYARQVGSLSAIRQMKDIQPPPYPVIADGGWHISWLGGPAEIHAKLDAFCHLETRDAALAANAEDLMYGQGRGDVLAAPMRAVDVDESWPRWIYERKCPAGWFRPREAG